MHPRDKYVVKACNFLLRTFASKAYNNLLSKVVNEGMKKLEDQLKERRMREHEAKYHSEEEKVREG